MIKANADGSFDLPENIDKKNIYYYVEDFAGNVDYVSPVSYTHLTADDVELLRHLPVEAGAPDPDTKDF